MSKEEFSDHEQETNSTRRGGQKHGSFGGKNADEKTGAELRQTGAHSNTGVGDEQTPIRENSDE